MKHLYKRMAAAMVALFCLLALTGCGSSETGAVGSLKGGSGGNGADEESIQIVATIFPAYDWIREVVSEDTQNVELILLLDSGVDLHSYQPTAEDIMKISSCDLFVYVGGESDAWVEDCLAEAVNPDMVVINLIETLGDFAKEEQFVEGMEREPDDGEEASVDGTDMAEADGKMTDGTAAEADGKVTADGIETEAADEDEAEYDEHVWLSLRNAQIFVNQIMNQMATLDPARAEAYAENAAAYIEKLQALDQEYETVTAESKRDVLLFGDRFPFRYLTDDYGLSYYAAFAGCSAETEASFETITFLAGKVDELGLTSVLMLEGSSDKIARTIIDNTGSRDQKLLVLDSMQTTNAGNIADGVTYLSVMEHNLEVLGEALN